MVLLVVDTQELIITNNLFMFETLVYNVKLLIKSARDNNVEVIYVVHDDGAESDLTQGKDGFEIYKEFKPLDFEKIFVKTVNSAFKNTGLLDYLKDKNENDIVVTGLQTDLCIDATVKCGFEHGFNVIIPQYANSTVDNRFMTGEQSYKYYNEFIWQNRYAKSLTIDETVKLFR